MKVEITYKDEKIETIYDVFKNGRIRMDRGRIVKKEGFIQ